MTALLKDLEENLPKENIETLYFGGGTPSLIPIRYLKQMVEIAKEKSTHEIKEITLEANPESLIQYDLHELVKTGIDRLSIGIQSWQPSILKTMNREFDAVSLKRYITELRESGFQNINLDHIISFPGQSFDMIRDDIEQSLSLLPTHISIYPLEIHKGTRLYELVKQKQVARLTDSASVKAFSIAQLIIQKHGYRHYEELNFAKPGFECLHNLCFWQGKKYLGFGPGAISRSDGIIKENKKNVEEYIAAVQDGLSSPHSTTHLTDQQLRTLDIDLKSRIQQIID